MNKETKNTELLLEQKTYTVDMSEGFDAAAQVDIILQFIKERLRTENILLCGVGTNKKNLKPKQEFFAYTPGEMKSDPEQATIFPGEGANSFVIVYDASQCTSSTDGRVSHYTLKPETQCADAIVGVLKLQY